MIQHCVVDAEPCPKTAVIKESLRFGHGVVSPLPRVTQEDTIVGGRLVPAGVRMHELLCRYLKLTF